MSGGVRVTAEPRTDVVVDRGGAAAATADGAVEIRAGRPSDSVDVRCPAGADVIVGTRSGGVRLDGRFGTVGVTSQSGSIRVAAVAEADLRTVSGVVELEECDGRCRVSTTSGRITVGCDPRRRDLHDVGFGRRRRCGGGGPGAFGQRHGDCRLVGRRSCQCQHRLGLDHDPPAARRAPHGAVIGPGQGAQRFEPGDDVVVDIATVSGTVRLVPA